jgi:SAM-dependent methyltransferase
VAERQVARYDAHAHWYERSVSEPGRNELSQRSGVALVELVGTGPGWCLDVGCGTGVHASALRAAGWRVFGLDISVGQLRFARERLPVAVADAARLPLPTGTLGAVVASHIHTDVESFDAVVSEAARVLRAGGRFAYVGVHPCFVGPFAERAGNGTTVLHSGYEHDDLVFSGPGIGNGIRSKVGVRHRTLQATLSAVLNAGLELSTVREYQPAGRPLPDLLGILAAANG